MCVREIAEMPGESGSLLFVSPIKRILYADEVSRSIFSLRIEFSSFQRSWDGKYRDVRSANFCLVPE